MKKSKVPILLLWVFCCIIAAGTAFGLNKVTETAAGGAADMAMQEEQLAEVLQVTDEQGDEISLTELPEENYDGFIFKIEDSAGKQQVEQKLEDAVDDGAVDCIAEDLYTADDLQVIIDNVDEGKLEYVEPNYIVNMIGEVEELDSSELAPNDKLYQNGKQWNLDMMNVFEAWEYDTYGANLDTGEPVKVAVIDSGLYGTGSSESKHEDIDYSKVIAGVNLATSSAGTPDSEGHGTFVSGMIFAQINNDKGIAGIMPQVNIVPIKVFDTDSCSTAVVIEGINKAVEYGVDVINMSLGGEGSSTALKEACDNAAAAGILVVTAVMDNPDKVYVTVEIPATNAYFSEKPSSVDENGCITLAGYCLRSSADIIVYKLSGNMTYESSETHSVQVDNGKFSLQLKDLEAGSYLAKISNDSFVFVK